MILRLQHQRPDGEVDSYFLKPGRRYHIGRGSSCEVRILDLKLSRKHCALEFGDRGWQAVDLMSTNGCTLDGDQIVGNVPVQTGSVIEAGQTKLTVAEIFEPESEDALAASPSPVANAPRATRRKEADSDEDHTETTSPTPTIEQEPLPEGPSNPSGRMETGHRKDWEPEPNSDALSKSDALVPHPGRDPSLPRTRTPAPGTGEVRRPTAVFRAEDQAIDSRGRQEEQDQLPTRLHAPDPSKAPLASVAPSAPIAPTPVAATTPGSDLHERTFYITVLGRRVGPLTRSAARDLKARELKGTLTTADLEQYPLG